MKLSKGHKENLIYAISLTIVFAFLTYLLRPLHELLHSLACLILGLEPKIWLSKATCEGIGNGLTFQIFFKTFPYLVNLIFLGLVFLTRNKIGYMKYLSLIPFFEIIGQLFRIPLTNKNDFWTLWQSIGIKWVFWLVIIPLVISEIILSLLIFRDTNLIFYSTFKRDFSKFKEFFEL